MHTDNRRAARRGRAQGWQQRAACRERDAALFFHPAGERGEEHRAREAAAKRVCTCCPVLGQCLEYALAAGEQYGVWGGRSEDERRALRARRRRAAAARA